MPTGARLHLDSVNLIRLELAANACPIPRVPGISEELLLSEIAYALHPHLHEQRIAPYGVVALSESFEFFPVSRRITLAEIDIDSMRQLADGRRTVIVYPAKDEPELWWLRELIEQEGHVAFISTLRHVGMILKRRENGAVTLVQQGDFYTISHREWRVRKPIDAIYDAISHIGSVDQATAQSILKACCYHLSPRGTGGTIVWFLKEPSAVEASLWGPPDLRHLPLSLDALDQAPYLIHLARYADGAMVVDPSGKLRGLGAHLPYTQETAALVGPYRGTRHTSAKRYSFEHPATIVFVVSQDGDVSVFSDGAKIADSPLLHAADEAAALKRAVPTKKADVSSSSDSVTCGRCGKDLLIEIVTVTGWKEKESVSCPICGATAYSAMCWQLKAIPIKSLH